MSQVGEDWDRTAMHHALIHIPKYCFVSGMPTMPICWIVAGPNGAGKTTFALDYLPLVANCTRFVNADLIAAGLSPLDPEGEVKAASRLFLNEIQSAIAARRDFAYETTLAGRGYLKLIRKLRSEGWKVMLIYLALPGLEMSKLRVAERVAHGGHNIPLADIERRFTRSLANLFGLFSKEVDVCRCFMNHENRPALVFEEVCGLRVIANVQYYEDLIREITP